MLEPGKELGENKLIKLSIVILLQIFQNVVEKIYIVEDITNRLFKGSQLINNYSPKWR